MKHTIDPHRPEDSIEPRSRNRNRGTVKPIWSGKELDVLRQHFETKGPGMIYREGLLPGRSLRSIQRRGKRLGLHAKRRNRHNSGVPANGNTTHGLHARKPIGFSGPDAELMKAAVCGSWRC